MRAVEDIFSEAKSFLHGELFGIWQYTSGGVFGTTTKEDTSSDFVKITPETKDFRLDSHRLSDSSYIVQRLGTILSSRIRRRLREWKDERLKNLALTDANRRRFMNYFVPMNEHVERNVDEFSRRNQILKYTSGLPEQWGGPSAQEVKQ